MGELIRIVGRDGHALDAYLAVPAAPPRAGIVVLQEIFGVNAHLRAVAEGFAGEGYLSIAPSLFDRIRRGIALEHSPAAIEEGISCAQRLEAEHVVSDIEAARARLEGVGRVGVVGYCLGGRFAYLAACEVAIACAVVYYGGPITPLLDKTPKCPVLYHFAEHDKYIPLAEVEQIRKAHPEGTFHLYPAGHGFSSDDRPEYDPACAALARRRTLDFLAHHLPRSSRAASSRCPH